jgi:hypothetical protein
MDIPVLDVGAPSAVPPEWERYGAYYLADDLILSSTIDGTTGMPTTFYSVYKKLKVLNADGAKFATMIIPYYTSTLQSFDIELTDARGEQIDVNEMAMRTKYEETGKVVVPSVGAGATVSVRLLFTSLNAPAAIERWFRAPLPVYEGRFLVHLDENLRFSYEHARYGNRAFATMTMPDVYGGKNLCWTVHDLLPADSAPYSRWYSESEPRVSLRMNPLYDDERNKVENWNGIARLIKAYKITPALSDTTEAISYKIAEITRGINDERRQAEAIISWIQQNITCYMQPVQWTIGRTLAEGKSDMILATLLCREMLRTVGIDADLVLTRAKSRGGFDPAFLSYQTCTEGLLIVRIGGTPMVVCPQFTNYPPGTCPPEYIGCIGLNIDKGDTVTLPPPSWKNFAVSSHATLRFTSDTAVNTLRLRYDALSTSDMRGTLKRRGSDEQRTFVEHVLQNRGEQNELRSFSIHALDNLDSPLELTIRFCNNAPPVEMPDLARHDLSPLLTPAFIGLDSSRTGDIVVTVPAVIRDTIELMKLPDRTMQPDIEAWQTSNALFDGTIGSAETDTSLMIIREILLHACTITRIQFQPVFSAIYGLNRASRVAVSIMTKPAARIAKPVRRSGK